MNKQEFIRELTQSLEGQVPNRIVRDNVKYYRSCISEEAAKSQRSEAQVIEEWGSPRLIAKTIIEAYEAEYGPYEGQSSQFYEGESTGNFVEKDNKFPYTKGNFNSCLPIVLLGICIIAVLGVIVFRLIFSVPGLVICLLLIFIIWYYSGHRG